MHKEIKILAVGNSFSENANYYLPDLCRMGEVNLKVGRLFIGGCSLERHWQNVTTGESGYIYNYDETLPDDRQRMISIPEAAALEDWDAVTFQQASHFSGLAETYFPYLDQLSAYFHEKLPRAIQVIHQTWAYQKDADHPGFLSYGRDQEQMYRSLKTAYAHAAARIRADLSLPVGDAWQLARATEVGDTLCQDGYHGNAKGCFLGAAVWYEAFTGQNVMENPFAPEGISAREMEILRRCAHEAVKGVKG